MPLIEVNRMDIYYEIKGDGTPILFIHPPLLTSVSFAHQSSELSKHFQTITFDIRGHGKSQHSKEALTYPLIVEDIKQLMDALGINKAFFCGYSTGGSVVLELLLTHPERAMGAILIGGMPEVHHLRLRTLITVGAILAKMGAMRTLALGIAYSNSDTLHMFRDEYKSAVQGNPKNVEQYFRYSLMYNCSDKLSQIEIPTLLIYGEKDKVFHSYANILHTHLPYSELKFIQGAGHTIPAKAPTKLNEYITKFIDDMVQDEKT